MVDHAASTYPDQPAGAEDRWWLPAHLGGDAPSVSAAAAAADRERQQRLEQRRAERSQGGDRSAS
jgi:hypothetical protein